MCVCVCVCMAMGVHVCDCLSVKDDYVTLLKGHSRSHQCTIKKLSDSQEGNPSEPHRRCAAHATHGYGEETYEDLMSAGHTRLLYSK